VITVAPRIPVETTMPAQPNLVTIPWDGKPITRPGMYSKIPLDTYHSQFICDGPSVSSSGLRKIFTESPKHFFASWDGNPNRIAKKDARHFILGRAVHHLILGEPYFAKLFCVQPNVIRVPEEGVVKWNNNRPQCKEWAAQQRHAGRAILLPGEVPVIRGMAREICAHPFYQAGLLKGWIERSLIWKDKETGIWLKWRPDVIPRDSADFADLKTTTSVLWLDLMMTIADLGYYQQAALGRWACTEVLRMDMASFTYLFVEKTEPYAVRDVRLVDEDLKRGEDANRVALELLARCLEKNDWPGPGAGNEGNDRVPLSDRARDAIDKRLHHIDPARHP
jgi:hypothetical protein